MLNVKSNHHSTDLILNEYEALCVFLSKEADGWSSSVPQSLSLASLCLCQQLSSMVRLEAGKAHPPLIDQEMVQLGKPLAWSCWSPWSIYTPKRGKLCIKICSSRNHIRLHFLTCFQRCNPGLLTQSECCIQVESAVM